MNITRQLNLRWRFKPKTDFCLKHRGLKTDFCKVNHPKNGFFTENMVLKTDFPGINDKENGFFRR